MQHTDFWLTDEHSDDNTQQGLIDIADGAAVLERYVADVRGLLDSMRSATTTKDKAKYAKRAQETAVVYDRELDRWLVIVHSALDDVQRRLVEAKLRRQLWRALRPMPTGTNPPALPPLKH
ncbi:MAG: hypothetical protein DMD55_17175 [Gemmatimonadetes bacterium]|nr:MAG: hypothetical protein DMD55_17175 [Gemmatimonadota bacterium]